MKITRFEDVEGWKAARALNRDVVLVLKARKRFFDPFLQRQMRKCTISAMANVAEGFDSGTDREFLRFLKIGYRSVTELQSHLYAALDESSIDAPAFDGMYAKAQETKSIIGGFMRYLRKSC